MREKSIRICLVIFSVIVGAACMFFFMTSPLCKKLFENSTVYKKTTIIDKDGISASVEKVYNAVVLIRNYSNNKLASSGTGFVYKKINDKGYILTNYHVVSSSKDIRITLSTDEEVKATYVGGDEYLDLAVITIPANKVLAVAEIGNSEKSKLGDSVFTVGSPLGYDYRGTVTSGILSGRNRIVEVAVGDSSSANYAMKVLQTDAAINPGNSGGPLLNINGEVIGINSMKLVQDEIEGMGFAIPIEYAMAHINELESGKAIKRPMLGVTLINVSNTTALYQYGFNVGDITEGAVVAEVYKNSGAGKAGIKKGDIIIKIDNQKVVSVGYLRYELFKHKVGDTVNITYIRNGKEHTAKVKLTEEAD